MVCVTVLWEDVAWLSLSSELSLLSFDVFAGCDWVSGVSVGWAAVLVAEAAVLDAAEDD